MQPFARQRRREANLMVLHSFLGRIPLFGVKGDARGKYFKLGSRVLPRRTDCL